MLFRSLLLVMLLLPTLAQAYWNEAWGFRTTVTVTENSGTTLSGYEVLLNISGSDLHNLYNWSADGRDLRILDSDDNTQLNYFIENWNAGTETASVWVYFPTLSASSNRTIYLYYGNENAGAATQAPPVFTYAGIKFHTRRVTGDPNSKAQAFNLFNAASDSVSGYGCTFIENFTGVTNSGSFPNGQNGNFIAYSESFFEVRATQEGNWGFRYGADFGRGGGLYVDGQTLEQVWNQDLWWANNWNNTNETLEGTINLTAGYHKLEVIGAEGCCDGGITVQFRPPGGSWTTFTTHDIDIRSYSCPSADVVDPGITFGAHQTRVADLQVTATEPLLWVVNSARELILNVSNNGPQSSSSPASLNITLDSALSVDSVQGTGWSCNGSSGSFTCTYTGTVAAGTAFPALTLWIRAVSSTASSAFYTAQVSAVRYDNNSSNNLASGNVGLRQLTLPSGVGCSSPGNGLWTRFFDTRTSSVNYPANATEYQQMVDTFANETYLDGQTLRDNINGSGNPFDNRGDEYYLTLFQGYLFIPSDGDWGLAVDGDDALEILLNGTVRASWYGGHGASGSATNGVTVGLARGYHLFEFRHQEAQGGDSYTAYWRQGTSGSYGVIPAANFVQCGGVYNLELTPSLVVVSDPINGTTSPKAIPGAELDYTVVARNRGSLNSDTDTTEVIQALDSNSADLFIGDGSASPIVFADGTGMQSSGVTFSYPTGLTLSCDGGATFTCVPTADANGYAAGVTHFRLMLQGSMMPELGTLQPQFTYQYRVRLK